MPILTGILLKTDDDMLKLSATDLGVSIQGKIYCEIIEEGEIVIPCNLFKKYVDKLPKGNIELSIDDNRITISGEGTSLEFSGYNSDEFPLIEEYHNDGLTIDQSSLNKLIEKTKFAVTQSNAEIDPVLQSLNLNTKNNHLLAVGTNTFRLALTKEQLDVEQSFDINLPLKTVNILSKLLHSGDANISFANSKVIFELENYTVTSRIIHGDYPDYNQIIPEDETFNSKIIIDKNEFKKSIERAMLLNEDNIIKLIFKDNKVIIKEYESQIGTIEEKVECSIEGDNLTTNLNGKYILDMLKTMDTTDVIMQGISKEKPFVIKEDGEDRIYVVMPVREL